MILFFFYFGLDRCENSNCLASHRYVPNHECVGSKHGTMKGNLASSMFPRHPVETSLQETDFGLQH